jgi:hypothetical protein
MFVVCTFGSHAVVSADDKESPKSVPKSSTSKSYSIKNTPIDIVRINGILADRSWGQEKWRFQVLADGELEATDYILGDNPEQKLVDSLKQLFHTGRVQVEYKLEGDKRRLISIKRLPSRGQGSVTGEVLQNYGWWLVVKPKVGLADGYASQMPPDQHKPMLDKIKTIEKGDIVTITYFSDFERHRMYTLQKVGTAKK